MKLSVQERITIILREATGQDLNSWEKEFLATLKSRNSRSLSEKQEACLKKIEDKLGIEEGDEDRKPLNYDDLSF